MSLVALVGAFLRIPTKPNFLQHFPPKLQIKRKQRKFQYLLSKMEAIVERGAPSQVLVTSDGFDAAASAAFVFVPWPGTCRSSTLQT